MSTVNKIIKTPVEKASAFTERFFFFNDHSGKKAVSLLDADGVRDRFLQYIEDELAREQDELDVVDETLEDFLIYSEVGEVFCFGDEHGPEELTRIQ